MIARATVLMVVLASTASAADERSLAVGGRVSALNLDSGTDLSVSGSLEFRFGRVVGLEIEATHAPALRSPFPRPPVNILASPAAPALTTAVLPAPSVSALIFPPPVYSNPGGRAVMMSNNVRVAIPTEVSRLEPYFVAGGGLASVRHTADLVYTSFAFTPASPAVTVPSTPNTRTFTQRVTASSLDLVLTLGGGVGVRTLSRLWIDADLRLVRLLGNQDRNAGRFGVGARYRF
jgi:hypothetical protein